MKVYVTREICGYARGEEIEVYKLFKDDSTWWGLIWSKSLCSWVECQIKYFSMEPIEKDDEGEDPDSPSTTEETKIGRLIDADALAKEVENAYKFAIGEVRQAYSFILDLIADAPTIPAPRPEDIKNGEEDRNG